MTQDYIMRVIEQCIQAILDIIQRRKSGDLKAARELVQATSRYLLKTNLDLLLFYPPDQILEQFKDFSNHLETEKCVLTADLIYELALIEESEGHPLESLRLKTLCLYLYTVAIPKEPQFQTKPYLEKVDSVIEELKNEPLSEQALLSLQFYCSEKKGFKSDVP